MTCTCVPLAEMARTACAAKFLIWHGPLPCPHAPLAEFGTHHVAPNMVPCAPNMVPCAPNVAPCTPNMAPCAPNGTLTMYSPSASSRLCANLASCGSSHPGGGSSGSDPSDVSCECISCECISRNSEYRLSSMYRAPLHATWTGYAHGPVASSRTLSY
eukprot:4359414-Prymnesium_polylepis.2